MLTWRSAQRVRSIILQNLAETKVGDLDESTVVDHDVLRLEVAINHAHLVDVIEPQEHLSRVESCTVVAELVSAERIRISTRNLTYRSTHFRKCVNISPPLRNGMPKYK